MWSCNLQLATCCQPTSQSCNLPASKHQTEILHSQACNQPVSNLQPLSFSQLAQSPMTDLPSSNQPASQQLNQHSRLTKSNLHFPYASQPASQPASPPSIQPASQSTGKPTNQPAILQPSASNIQVSASIQSREVGRDTDQLINLPTDPLVQPPVSILQPTSQPARQSTFNPPASRLQLPTSHPTFHLPIHLQIGLVPACHCHPDKLPTSDQLANWSID